MGRPVFDTINSAGILKSGGRILEIGPKHGRDTVLLAALRPTELVAIELPEKTPALEKWWGAIQCNKRLIYDNLLYMSDIESLGKFDLVWCTGVLYHNVEQIRLLRRLFDLCNVGALTVIESRVIKGYDDACTIRVCRPGEFWGTPADGIPAQGWDKDSVIHIPSRGAVKVWLELVGFQNVREWRDVYPPEYAPQRAIFTGERTEQSSPYRYYRSADFAGYDIGKAA